MHGLTVRWSLANAPGKPGLRFKTWRMRPREWFEVVAVAEGGSGFLAAASYA